MKLSRDFYNRGTLTCAKELLGKYLVRDFEKTGYPKEFLQYYKTFYDTKRPPEKLVGKIVETEAYKGLDDLASHASRGRTPRTEIMFGAPGYAYIYLVYGMYWCLNIVTEKKNYPAAVLIRAIEPLLTGDIRDKRDIKECKRKDFLHKTDGPGKLCRFLGIGKNLNGIDFCGDILWVEDQDERIKKEDIITTKRIGVDYAKHCKDHRWRFYIKNSPYISKR